MTAIGQLREKVRFEQRGLDANGDRLGDWDAAGGLTRAARIFFRTGSEPVLQARLRGVQPAEITVYADRAVRAVTSAWRVVDARSGKVFNIRAPAPGEDRQFITFLCDDDGGPGGV